MELQDEKMSFDDRNFSAYLNRSYSDGFFPPPDIFGKQRHSNGYLQACNRNEKGISSKHDYLSVQGSIREESQVDKVSDKPPDLPHRKYITNKEEVTELDDVRIYYEIADSTKLRTSGQSDVKCFDQKEYVLRPADDDCLPQDKETNKPSANFPCSPSYFLWLRNTNEKSSSSQAPSTTIQPHCSPPGNTILKLSPDQIANLGTYRSWFLHSCEADIGFPAGDLSIEIMKSGDLEFRSLDVTIESSQDNKTSCEIHRKIEFGIVFTSNMEKAIIRCKVMNTFFQDSSAFYSNNETISLIPRDACKDNTVSKSYRVHPTNCHYYIECKNKVPYGQACQYNHCFGIYNVEVCSPCKDDFIICPETNDSCANAITPQKKAVNMRVHADQIVGLTSPRISNLHTCTGNIGNRSEKIEVEMRLAGHSNYEIKDPMYTTKTEATVNCKLIRVIKFWINFTTEMHNATIRCKLTNDLNPDVSPAYSKPEMLFLVSDDFCYQDYNFTTSNKYHHPTTCHRFVTCVRNHTYVNECPSNLCFSVEKDYCDHCFKGSIKSNLQPDKEPDEPHSGLHSVEKEKKGDHCGNEKEFSDLDISPYSVIADSNIKQQEVKAFPLIKYVTHRMPIGLFS
ncbi:unnamed protein product [Mytilus edulis]|uniref:Chitin-binding type-2 domain-containing protein n=1 Tax=Mytilus edulis TaxID=6550 RepID=A0A8S3SUK8_MYTED|nr:unnamed protein product [Mytilus edulis]